MADFPDLEPAARSFTLGEYPLSLQKAWGLNAIPMRHGPAPAACQLTLTYEQISSSQATLIRNHYASQRGELLPFALSIAVFYGNSNPPRGPWKYNGPPEESHLDGGLVDVTVQLISAVMLGLSVQELGLTASVLVALLQGAPLIDGKLRGGTFTVTATLDPGTGNGGTYVPPGGTFTVTATLDPGTGNGGTYVPPPAFFDGLASQVFDWNEMISVDSWGS